MQKSRSLLSLSIVILAGLFFCPQIIHTEEKAAKKPREERTLRQKRARQKQERLEREKNKKNLKSCKTTAIRLMSYDDLKIAKDVYKAENNQQAYVKCIERMVELQENLEELPVLMLTLADAFFDEGKLPEAGKIYEEFRKLHPGNAKVEYAYYKAILCNYYSILSPAKDQTNTKKTITLAQEFLKQEVPFTTYGKEVNDILVQCNKRLMESDVQVFDFYIGRGMNKSSNKRLACIKEKYLPVLPAEEPMILTMECRLAEQENNLELLKQKRLELTQRFPDYQHSLPSVIAMPEKVSTTKMANRF